MKKLFGKFGMEPTYYSTAFNGVPDYWHTTKKWSATLWERAMGNVIDTIVYQKIAHPWWKNAHNDENVLEVPTTLYSSYAKFKKDLVELDKKLIKYDFVESSNVCMESQGGCHINMDISHLPKTKKHAEHKFLMLSHFGRGTYESISFTYKKTFFLNLIYFLSEHPPLVWSCIAANDNASSCIPRNAYVNCIDHLTLRKGHMVTARGKNDGIIDVSDCEDPTHIEFRMFMMHRNNKELDFHFKLANAIMHHVKEITDRGVVQQATKKLGMLAKYTRTTATHELIRVFKTLGVSYSEWCKLGKDDIFAQRFLYGKKYLV